MGLSIPGFGLQGDASGIAPSMPPNFQVLNPILLRILEKWIMEGKLGELFFGVSKLEYFRVTMKASPQTLFAAAFRFDF